MPCGALVTFQCGRGWQSGQAIVRAFNPAFAEICRAFPFRIHKLQCDNGHEFPFAFALAVQGLGIRHRCIKPRRPQQNGKVERSHRIDQEEFWGRHRFADFETAAVGLRAWETRYPGENRHRGADFQTMVPSWCQT